MSTLALSTNLDASGPDEFDTNEIAARANASTEQVKDKFCLDEKNW